MAQTTYDVIVLGLGGMGSAAAHHLAERGARVLGLEKFGPAHNKGSSHGGSRITRQSYFEDPAYVPLLLRAYELYERLERDSGQDIATLCGGLMVGRPESFPSPGPCARPASGTCRTSCSTRANSGAASRRSPRRTTRSPCTRPRRGCCGRRAPCPPSSGSPPVAGPSCASRSR